MAIVFWLFLAYGFFGYLLEKGYAAATHAAKQTRKTFLFTPVCLVYGLGVLAVLALPAGVRSNFFALALWGGLIATAVEYAVHWFYEAVFSVRFWDYTEVRGNVGGRVCLPFSLIWSLLLAAALPLVQPPLLALAAAVPPEITLAAMLLFTADIVCTCRVLWLYGDTELLALKSWQGEKQLGENQ